MRVVLADLKGNEGFVSKDTVVGGYGSRSKSFTRVTSVVCQVKWRFQVALSVQTSAHLAAIAAACGHEVVFTRDAFAEGDMAIATGLTLKRMDSANGPLARVGSRRPTRRWQVPPAL